ncbi:carbohydrate esterase family 1 protein [Oidiodendron maius Zn]|uniref:Carboxylic ester hydrolase n=1 Tax=Oidiodendron maius (strain Zn) TaxID=913774 RepID=A0A0C3H387_OIDMZ|nr:carbohydrate esterase family 1 protein [Oidiodendron maius Zn]
MHFLSTAATLLALTSLGNALSSSLQQVTGFNSGPTAAGMYIYVPTNKVSPAPIILAIHYCTGTANAYFSSTLYAQYADTYGYIVIYPNSPSPGGCWDVSSTASLTHNGGGDSETIINMVQYAVEHYGGDSSRVFATGSSSGAMMTNVLAGAYPNVIKAGSVYSGVPDGCFYVAGATAGMQTPAWNSQCADGQLIETAQQWGDLTRSYYPGYTGSRPKMLIWHGTIDTTLYYENLAQTLLQWSNVLGISFTKNNTNTPQSGYTQMVYGDGTELIGYSALNVGHTVPVHETVDLAWFGITGSGGTTTSVPSSSPTSTALPTSSTAGGTIPKWGQW